MSAYFESLNRRRARVVPTPSAPVSRPPEAAPTAPAAVPAPVRPLGLPPRLPRPSAVPPPSAYATLRERLLAAGNGQALRSVVFAGCDGNEGCTQVVCEFAELLAATGLNVLLIDADLRTSGLTVSTGAGGSNLRELASGSTLPPAREVGKGRLTIVPSPASSGDKEHFFGTPEFAGWLDAQRGRYDYVLLDAPPLLKFADGQLLGRLTDGVIVVVRAEVTSREAIARAREQLERAGVRVIGAVLNRAREVVPAALRKFLSTE
jgi:Mrp family chromosome partitioning ATPase